MDSSTESDDIYQQWLEIPAEYCPPNHYALLGIDDFCDDTDVIDGAAKNRTAYLHQIAAGPNRKAVQRLMGEVAVARRTLLNSEARSEYDEWLLAPDEDATPTEASPAFAIQSQPRSASPAKRASTTEKTPNNDRPTENKSSSRRKQKSAWDAYKLHLLSASFLAAAVGIFAFVNRSGGRRATAVSSTNSSPAGQGFQRQTPSTLPAGRAPQKKLAAQTSPKKTNRPSLSGPAGFDTLAGDAQTSTAIASPIFDDPKKTPTLEISKASAVKLSGNPLDGLARQDTFTDSFHDQFESSPSNKQAVRIADDKLFVVIDESKPAYPRFISKTQKLAPGFAIAVDTNLRPGINGKAAIGLVVGSQLVQIQATKVGISVKVRPIPSNGKPKHIENLRSKANLAKSTLVLSRDAADPRALHWLLIAGKSNRAGTIVTEMDAQDADVGISVSVPDDKMSHPLSLSNFRIGKLKTAPKWPK